MFHFSKLDYLCLSKFVSHSFMPVGLTITFFTGFFNLDPNRVLGVMLDSFEQRPEQVEFFIPLIQQYMPDPKILSEVLAFKFFFYQNGIVPRSLYIVTALMLQHKVVVLDDIYSWVCINFVVGT